MKQRSKNLFTIAGALIVLAAMLYSCGGGGGGGYGSSYTPPMSTGPVATGSVQVVACPGTTAVSIVNMTTGFSPPSVTVPVNTIVQWTNNDPSVTHTVTSTSTVPASIATFDSMNLAPGTSVCFKFISAGTYNYHCSIHTNMIGAVIAQ